MITQSRPESGGARMAYERMAPFYDDFTAHHDYELWAGNLLPALEERGLRRGRALDVACGTGKSFLPLLARGWEVTGCDISAPMLARAREKTNGRVRLEVADMRSLPVLGPFDLVWCLDDAVNYMLSTAELTACLTRMGANLAAGGLLLFDVNTLRTYRTFYAETQVSERAGRRLIWRGLGAPDAPPGSEVEAAFEVESQNGQTAVARGSAVHRQRHFRPGEVRECLRRAGLDCLAVFGHGFDARLQQPLDESRHTKAIFIARPM